MYFLVNTYRLIQYKFSKSTLTPITFKSFYRVAHFNLALLRAYLHIAE